MNNEQKTIFINPDRAQYLKAKLIGFTKIDTRRIKAKESLKLNVQEREYLVTISSHSVEADTNVLLYILDLVKGIEIMNYNSLNSIPIGQLSPLYISESLKNKLEASNFKHIGDLIKVIDSENDRNAFFPHEHFDSASMKELVMGLRAYGVSATRFSHSFDTYLHYSFK
jgi:hypothetical protein